MNLYIVDDTTLCLLRDLERRRNEQAFIVGTAAIEFEFRRNEIVRKYGDAQSRNEHVGSAYYEFRSALDQALRLINASQKDQKQIGERALAALGLDFTKDELTIDENSGTVMRLVAGEWVPMQKEGDI